MKTKTIITTVLMLFSIMLFAQNKEHKEYYDNGKLFAQGYITSDGEKTGEWKYYDKDYGKLVDTRNYKNGKIDGEGKKYYDDGKVYATFSYKDDKLNGVTKSYHENGKIATIENYVNDELNGELKNYHENGKIALIQNYNNDELNGEEKSYDEEGMLESSIMCKNDKLDGERKTFYKSGKVKWIEDWVNGEKIGNTAYYYENGQKDTRTDELKTLLSQYLMPKDKDITITKIEVLQSAVIVFYTDKSNDPEKYVKLPQNIKEVDNEGIIRYAGYDVKFYMKYKDQYISVMESSYLLGLSIKKEGRKKIEELMKSIAKDSK